MKKSLTFIVALVLAFPSPPVVVAAVHPARARPSIRRQTQRETSRQPIRRAATAAPSLTANSRMSMIR